MSDVSDDPSSSEIPWRPPVIAAITGALAVSVFVIYAIVTGPTEPSEVDLIALQPVPSIDVPPGYTPIPNDPGVGIKVESVVRDDGSSTVVVSSAVQGTTDPADSLPPDVAFWEMGPDGNRIVMATQLAAGDAVGTTTIVFPAEILPSDAFVVAHPVTQFASAESEIEVPPDMMGEPIAFVLEVMPGAAISGLVTVGAGWGTVEWSSPDGMVAALDVEVTFVGTENAAADAFDPIRLVPSYVPSLGLPRTVVMPRPLYGFGGRYGLQGDGRLLADGIEATAIVINLRGTVVTETGDPVNLELPPG